MLRLKVTHVSEGGATDVWLKVFPFKERFVEVLLSLFECTP